MPGHHPLIFTTMSTKKAARKSAKKTASKPVKKVAAKKPAKAAEAAASMPRPGEFAWNELMTSDSGAATSFYTRLFGWKSRPFGHGMDYTVLENGGKSAAGLMKTPEGGPSPMWLAYVVVKDMNAAAAKVVELGGRICKPPFAIPGVGQIAIVQDPQGAMFGLHAC